MGGIPSYVRRHPGPCASATIALFARFRPIAMRREETTRDGRSMFHAGPSPQLEIPGPAQMLGPMRIGASRIVEVWVVSLLLALVFVLRVSADPSPAPDADSTVQAEQDHQAPEYACQRLNEQGEKVDCWCVQAVARAEPPEIGAIVAELDRHMAAWRQENLLERVTKPCLKRCAEAFDKTIARKADEISRYEAADDLLSEVAGTIPRGACPEAERYNDQFLHYECWLRRGDITDAQFRLLSSYGYHSPAHISSMNGIYLANVRSRAAKRSCMLACCGSNPPTPGYPDSRLRNRRIQRAGEMYRN